MRRLAIAVVVVLLAGCGGGTPRAASPTIPRTTTSVTIPTSAPPTTTIPQDFYAESVTFVSTQLGWVLGNTSSVSFAPVLLRTEDGGRTWSRLPTPFDDSVSEVRFADAEDGWVTSDESSPHPGQGADLWATRDGGLQWHRPQLPGVPPNEGVADVEAAAGMVSASFFGFPTEIETSPVHIDDWSLSRTTVPGGAGGAPSDQIVLQGTAGWLIDDDRGVLGGARLDNDAWVPWSPPCSHVQALAMLAASDPSHLEAVCYQGVDTGSAPVIRAYFSSDGGSTFEPSSTALPQDSFGPIASPAPGVVIIGGSGDLIGTFDGGATWSVVSRQANSVSWVQVGFTTASQGVAIGNGTLFMTFDGGHVWNPVDFSPMQR